MLEALILTQLTLNPHDPYREWNSQADSFYAEQEQRRRIEDLNRRVLDLEQRQHFDIGDQILRDYFRPQRRYYDGPR